LFKDGYTPSIDYALDWCVTGNDDKLSAGRFHTVADMLTQFLPQEKDKSPLKRYWDKVKDTMYDQFLMVDNDFYRTKLLEDWISINYVVQEVDRVSKEDLTNA
jgi:S-adenosylmethionine:diacylglycerol 3-amino-3-carboxypropyl transferase